MEIICNKSGGSAVVLGNKKKLNKINRPSNKNKKIINL
jgi:hypothetical protein